MNGDALRLLRALLPKKDKSSFKDRLLSFYLKCRNENRSYPISNTKELMEALNVVE